MPQSTACRLTKKKIFHSFLVTCCDTLGEVVPGAEAGIRLVTRVHAVMATEIPAARKHCLDAVLLCFGSPRPHLREAKVDVALGQQEHRVLDRAARPDAGIGGGSRCQLVLAEPLPIAPGGLMPVTIVPVENDDWTRKACTRLHVGERDPTHGEARRDLGGDVTHGPGHIPQMPDPGMDRELQAPKRGVSSSPRRVTPRRSDTLERSAQGIGRSPG